MEKQRHLKVSGSPTAVNCGCQAFKPAEITPETLQGFVESNGYVSMEAEHYTKKTDAGDKPLDQNRRLWAHLVGHAGNRKCRCRACQSRQGFSLPGIPDVSVYNRKSGSESGFCTYLNFLPDRALRYGISLDNEAPQIITLVPENYNAQNGNTDWEKSVSDNFRVGQSLHTLPNHGYHTLKIWMIDPGVVLQKIVVNTGGVRPSYLGPPESFFRDPRQMAAIRNSIMP